jgi:hypothetical protein
MKNYNSIEELQEEYIPNTNNISTNADWIGVSWYYYKMTKVRGVIVTPMVNVKDFSHYLRFDPITIQEYREYERIAEQYGNPGWIQLS